MGHKLQKREREALRAKRNLAYAKAIRSAMVTGDAIRTSLAPRKGIPIDFQVTVTRYRPDWAFNGSHAKSVAKRSHAKKIASR